jgi:DNA-binding NtrC family response regulator
MTCMASARKPERILLVDDSRDTLEVLERNLAARGFAVMTAAGGSEAIRSLEKCPVDLLITDVKMPGMSGIELLRLTREKFPETQVMLITGYATIEGAVEAVKTGAEEYLSKPFTSEELLAAVDRALQKHRLARSRRTVGPQLHLGLVGGSEAMRQAFGTMERATASKAPVLLLGENGTGRESTARALHGASPRTGKLFLALNGEAIPNDQLGSEADRGLALAGEGSLYLRAVDCWPQEVLERIAGHAGEATLPCRIMASAGPQFSSLIARGVLPEALSPFLDWETIRLPPLRERGADILLLAEHFARTTAHSCGRKAPELTSPLRQALLFYPWPGNVGELRGAISAAVREGASDPLDLPDLPAAIRSWSASRTPATRPLAEVEAEYIREVLSRVDGNKSRAAEILGIDRKTLREKLK